MGDRASVVLIKRYPAVPADKVWGQKRVPAWTERSPVLCQHWGGEQFHAEVRQWATQQYAQDHSQDNIKPSNRLEPERLFVKLIQAFGEGGYVGREREHVDDSNRGCLEIDLRDDGPRFRVLKHPWMLKFEKERRAERKAKREATGKAA